MCERACTCWTTSSKSVVKALTPCIIGCWLHMMSKNLLRPLGDALNTSHSHMFTFTRTPLYIEARNPCQRILPPPPGGSPAQSGNFPIYCAERRTEAGIQVARSAGSAAGVMPTDSLRLLSQESPRRTYTSAIFVCGHVMHTFMHVS